MFELITVDQLLECRAALANYPDPIRAELRTTEAAAIVLSCWFEALDAAAKRLVNDVENTIFTQQSVFCPARATDVRRKRVK
jgi:hypothetical protein